MISVSVINVKPKAKPFSPNSSYLGATHPHLTGAPYFVTPPSRTCFLLLISQISSSLFTSTLLACCCIIVTSVPSSSILAILRNGDSRMLILIHFSPLHGLDIILRSAMNLSEFAVSEYIVKGGPAWLKRCHKPSNRRDSEIIILWIQDVPHA